MFCTEPRAPHDFPFDKTAPNRTLRLSKTEIRTAPHRRILQIEKPYRGLVLHREKAWCFPPPLPQSRGLKSAFIVKRCGSAQTPFTRWTDHGLLLYIIWILASRYDEMLFRIRKLC